MAVEDKRVHDVDVSTVGRLREFLAQFPDDVAVKHAGELREVFPYVEEETTADGQRELWFLTD